MRSKFDEQLEQLNREMITMGMLCENAINGAAEALIDGDMEKANSVEHLLDHINEKERQIENVCFRLLLQQQPVASDLRTVSSALKMVTDMERIGDQSADIAEIVTMANITPGKDTMQFRDISGAVIKMVTDSIDAFVKKDIIIARLVIQYDDVVDEQFDVIKADLIERLKQQDINAEYVLDLLMIAKYFERIGDHAVNIAKWVTFCITGDRTIVE